MELQIKTWTNEYSKCTFDLFGKPYKITQDIFYQAKISDRNHRYSY